MADNTMSLKNINSSSNDQGISAGEFSSWLDRTLRILKTGGDIDVPCGGCTACCTSSYFIHINTEEAGTISRIPREIMFPAPGLPKGNLLLGFNEKGHCPMFRDNKCSIYEYRPRTCRTYDCRILAATGLAPGDDRMKIARQVNRWEFSFEGESGMKKFSAIRAAAEFISKHASHFPAGFIPGNTPQQALIAIKTYEVFTDLSNEQDDDIIKAVIDTYKRFEEKLRPDTIPDQL